MDVTTISYKLYDPYIAIDSDNFHSRNLTILIELGEAGESLRILPLERANTWVFVDFYKIIVFDACKIWK